jgi:hypothetical protein
LKKIISKEEIRAHLELEMSKFEQGGGTVTEIPRGLSGRDALDNSIPATRRLFLEPTEKRTLIPEVVAAIESRRKDKPVHKPKSRTPLKRRRKTIYDDFGEPLRTVWVEE